MGLLMLEQGPLLPGLLLMQELLLMLEPELLLMQELLRMPKLLLMQEPEQLLLMLLLLPELQKQQDKEEQEAHNWTLLSRLAYKHAGTWLASVGILLCKL